MAIGYKEQATPPTPASGQGTTYFDTSGDFHAKNDAGVDMNLSNAATLVILKKRKSMDQSKTTDTSVADDSELSLSVVSGKEYIINGILFCTAASATPDINVSMSGPTGEIVYSVGELIATTGDQIETDFTTNNNYALTSTSNFGIQFRGSFKATASGTFALQWAQKNSSADATTVLKGSFLKLTEI